MDCLKKKNLYILNRIKTMLRELYKFKDVNKKKMKKSKLQYLKYRKT